MSSFNALLGGGNGIPPSPEPSTGAITPEIELELKKFQDAHEMASESNQTLAKVIQVGKNGEIF